MNLIQQAVERASQIERDSKVVAPPLPPMHSLGHVHSRSFRPPPLNPSRVPLAAAALAVLALLGGAALYAALASSQADRAATPAMQAQAPKSPKPIDVPAAQAVEPVVTAAAPTVPVVLPVTAAAPSPAASAQATTEPAAAPIDEAKATVEAWARAWSERDVTRYLRYYGEGFAPENSASRAAWEKSRRQMIERRRSIAVTVRDLRVEPLSDQRVVAHYMQDYVADAYRESGTPKRLVLAREGPSWRIVAEANDKSSAGSL